MEATFEGQAAAFLLAVAQHQAKLLSYANSLTKDTDAGHDLYADTLLKCRDRIAASGFNGEGFVAYMVTSIKFNHFYAVRSAAKLDPVAYMEAQQAEGDNTEERQALAAGVRSFIVAHFLESEVAAFDLHLHGVTFEEIVFLTDYPNKVQVHRVIQKIKKEVRAAFCV